VPIVVAVNQNSMSFQWEPPANDGSCPITSYLLYIDDGNGGDFVVESEAAGKHYLRDFTA
jgi:hypothetical protein